MTVRDADTLKSYFALSKVPVPSQYNDLIDTLFAQGGGGGGFHDDRYVQLLSNNIISAVHTFSPTSATAPFILSANGRGQTVIGLKADSLNKSIIAGDGLTGGGGLTSNVTLNVGAGTLITVDSDLVGLSNGSSNYQFIGTSTTPWTPRYINISALAGEGLVHTTGILSVGQGDGLTVSADAIALTIPGTLSYNSSNSSSGSHTHEITSTSKPGNSSSLLKSDTNGYLELVKLYVDVITDQAGSSNLTLSPSGDITINPTGNDVLPYANYDINLGAINKKYLTLHAAELWVETLVAQDTIATIGGRILVGPTTVLTYDLSDSRSQLVLNPGFETSGSGGVDVFENWGEDAGSGTIVKDFVFFWDGSYSCKLTSGTGNDTHIYQTFNVTEKKAYTLSFYARGNGLTPGRYAVYDVTNATWIISAISTGVSAASWTKVSGITFIIPDGCTVISIYFYCAASGTTISSWFDTVNLYLDYIVVKHNQMDAYDIAYLEADGKVEFMRILTSAQGAGPYTYYVERDLDGTGTNNWYAGDAVFNTGYITDGFIDLYSISGVNAPTQYGPTIVGNVRSSGTYNDWIEHWAIGNLNGLYGYGSNTYGAAFGKYANSESFLTIDSTNGIRMRYRDSGGVETTRAQWDISGNILIGQTGVSQDNIYISSGSIALRVNTTTYINMTTAGVITVGEVGSSLDNIYISAGAIYFRVNTTNYMSMTTAGLITLGLSSGPNTVIASTGIQFKNSSTVNLDITSAGVITVGEVATAKENIQISSGAINFRLNTTTNLNISTSGVITIGPTSSPHTIIDSTGMVFNTSTGNPLLEIDASNEVVYVGLPQAIKLNDYGIRCLLTYGGSPNVGIIFDDTLNADDAGIFRINASIISSGQFEGHLEMMSFAGDAASSNLLELAAAAPTGGTGLKAGIVLLGNYTGTSSYVSLRLGGILRFDIYSASTVVNEQGNDYDFRIESDTNINMFYVDAGLNAVGIGGIPASGYEFTLTGDMRFSGDLYSYKNSTAYLGYIFVPLNPPATSTSYDGDAVNIGTYSIDTSSVFSIPTGVKAVSVFLAASFATVSGSTVASLSTKGSTVTQVQCRGQVNNYLISSSGTVSCDANGDIDLIIAGANATGVYIRITGYWI